MSGGSLLVLQSVIPHFYIVGTGVMLLGVITLQVKDYFLNFFGLEITLVKKDRQIIQCIILACMPATCFMSVAVLAIAVALVLVIIALVSAFVLFIFSWETFKYVHSDEAIVCLAYSAVGVIIGHFANQNALAGAITGAILGRVNYQIISVRWLKVKVKK